MIIAFKTIILSALFISFIGVVGEKKDTNLRNNLTVICVSSMLAFIVSDLYL